jgi:dihydrofolate synthase / folylpolyglutamate synthase
MTDFQVRMGPDSWDYAGAAGILERLPWASLAPHNCALAIEAAAHFTPLSEDLVRSALAGLSLPGRFERHQLGGRLLLVDVAHNPAGARFLRELVEIRYPGRRFTALLGVLDDKDVAGLAAAMQGLVRSWICAPTRGARGLSSVDLATRLRPAVTADCSIVAAADAADALERALAADEEGILAFGSFSLVEQVRNLLAAGAPAVPVAVGAGT